MQKNMKRAVIIGATSGIGREVARLLVRRGWLVGVAGRREDALLALQAEAPERTKSRQVDVTSKDCPRQILDLIALLGGMDLFLLCAGIGRQNPDLTPDIELDTAQTNVMGFIRTPEGPLGDGDKDEPEESLPLSAGEILRLNSGEEFQGFSPNRPNAALDPFLRFMVREVATGIGVSYEALSRDYSKSNYSSSRLSILDDRQAFRVLQNWLILKFLYPLYRRWFRAAALAGAFSVKAASSEEDAWIESVRFQAPGWSWIDPTKEVSAYVAAVQAGFTTVSDVIAQTGGDAEDTFKARRNELDYMDQLGLKFSTSETTMPPPAIQVDTEAASEKEAERVPSN